MSKFIVCKDNITANALKQMGFQAIPNGTDRFVFINNSNIKLNFDLIDKSKIYFSDILHI